MQVHSGLRANHAEFVRQCAPVRTARAGTGPRRKQRCVQLRATTEKTSKKSSYPEEDLEIDGFLPLRKPGAFPSVASATHDEFIDSGSASEDAPYDPLRDGPLRYLGYANECGEAFAAWIPPIGVPFSYGVAISYVLVDTLDKGLAAYREAQAELGGSAVSAEVNVGGLTKLLATERTMDTLVWQMLASVAIPGYTIHTIVAAVHAGLLPLEATQGLLDLFASAAPSVGTTPEVLLGLFDRTLPTMVGLGAIPFIVHPIDEGVHLLLNSSLRPAIKRYICANGGAAAGLELCRDCKTAEECEMPIDE